MTDEEWIERGKEACPVCQKPIGHHYQFGDALCLSRLARIYLVSQKLVGEAKTVLHWVDSPTGGVNITTFREALAEYEAVKGNEI